MENIESLCEQMQVQMAAYGRASLVAILDGVADDVHYSSMAEKLTLLIGAVLREHPFEDGNKRLAYAMGAMLLVQNGCFLALKRYAVEAENIVRHVEAGRMNDGLMHDLFVSIVNGEVDNSEELKIRYMLACTEEDLKAKGVEKEQSEPIYQPKSQLDTIPEGKVVAFISYSWDSEAHKRWVKQLADDMWTQYDIFVLCDCYNRLGENVVFFMRNAIARADRVLMIGTPNYRERMDKEGGGAAFEGYIIDRDIYKHIHTLKYIPILRAGTGFEESFGETVDSRIGLDFRNDADYEQNLETLACDILGRPVNARPCAIETNGKMIANKDESIWGQLFHYEKLGNKDLLDMLQKVVDNFAQGRVPSSMVEYTAAIINLCEINELTEINKEAWDNIKWSLQKRFGSNVDRDSLYSMNLEFLQTIDVLHSKTKTPMMKDIRDYVNDLYERLYEARKDRMTLLLEQLTDENIGFIPSQMKECTPDHSRMYGDTAIFANVDSKLLYEGIHNLSNASRVKLIGMLEDRYYLRNRFDGKCWLNYEEDIPTLTRLKDLITDNLGKYTLNDKRAMLQLNDRLEKAIERCNGETKILVE